MIVSMDYIFSFEKLIVWQKARQEAGRITVFNEAEKIIQDGAAKEEKDKTKL